MAFADECLLDDANTQEVEVRLRALARRSAWTSGHACFAQWGPLRLDFAAGLAEVDGREIVLQPLELRILGYLVRRGGRIVSCEELQRCVFRAAQAPHSTSIARQVSMLRKKMGVRRALIVTVPGGYQLDGAGDDAPVDTPVALAIRDLDQHNPRSPLHAPTRSNAGTSESP